MRLHVTVERAADRSSSATPFEHASCSVAPISAGVGATLTPAASSAAIFSAAVPLPPEMIAPAWPMRLPGGAVAPAMKAATGFFMFALMYSARALFGAAADLADHDDAVGVRDRR